MLIWTLDKVRLLHSPSYNTSFPKIPNKLTTKNWNPFYPSLIHSNLPQLKILGRIKGNFLAFTWHYFFPAKPLQNCSFWTKICLDFGLAPRHESKAFFIWFVEEAEARRIKTSRVKKQQVLRSLRQMPSFSRHFEPKLNKCRAPFAPSGIKYLSKVLIQLLSMPASRCSLTSMLEMSVPDHHVSCRIWPLICIRGTVPGVKGTDKIYTSPCLPFAPMVVPLSYFF